MRTNRGARVLAGALLLAGAAVVLLGWKDLWLQLGYAHHRGTRVDFEWYVKTWGIVPGPDVWIPDQLCVHCSSAQGPTADIAHEQCPTLVPKTRGRQTVLLTDDLCVGVGFNADGTFETRIIPLVGRRPSWDAHEALIAPPESWRCICPHVSHQKK